MKSNIGMGSLGAGSGIVSWDDPTLDPTYVLGGDVGSSPTYSPPIFSSPPISSNPNSDPPWWSILGPSIITTAGKDIQAVFGNQYQQPSYAGSGYYRNSYGQLVPYSQGTVQPAAGVTPSGLNLFGSQIGWGTIAVVGGIIVLIQARPFTRR